MLRQWLIDLLSIAFPSVVGLSIGNRFTYIGSATPAPPYPSNDILLENGTDILLLEDGVGYLLQET